MACVGCLFNSFSVFLLSLKQQQNVMKIVFSCIHFSNMAISPQNNEKKEKCFIPVNYMGWLHPVCCKREVFGYKETDLWMCSQN